MPASMQDSELFEQANMLFAGHTIADSVVALTLLAAFTFRLATESDEAADKAIDAHAADIKHHIRLNRAEIAEARTRMNLIPGNA